MTANGVMERRGPRRRRRAWRAGGRVARTGGGRLPTRVLAIVTDRRSGLLRSVDASGPRGGATSLPRTPGADPAGPPGSRLVPADLLLPGITATPVRTDRLTQQVFHPPRGGAARRRGGGSA